MVNHKLTEGKCRYCRSGSATNEQGEHWIVKSIWPAKITIVKCPDFKPPAAPPPSGEGR